MTKVSEDNKDHAFIADVVVSADKIGFDVSYSVQNNSFVNSKCKRCGESIKNGDLILSAHWFNTKHRGNETEFYENFHRKCSEGNEAWKVYDKEVNREIKKQAKKQDFKKAIKILKGNYKMVKMVLSSENESQH